MRQHAAQSHRLTTSQLPRHIQEQLCVRFDTGAVTVHVELDHHRNHDVRCRGAVNDGPGRFDIIQYDGQIRPALDECPDLRKLPRAIPTA